MKDDKVANLTLPKGTILGDYQIGDVLGQGEFGIVYSARDTKLNRKVAIKEHFPKSLCCRNPDTAELRPLTPALAGSYERSLNSYCKEARLIAQLEHPNIVQVYDIFQACETAYIVMSFVEGCHLGLWIQQHAHDKDHVKQMLLTLLDTLAYMHGKSVYHRDIKPSNIIITAADKLVLIDFGAALEGCPQGTLTLIGSPAFSPPEQFLADGKIGAWSDLYALGRSFEHALGSALSTYPKRFRRSLSKATQNDIEQRFTTAQEWSQYLRQKGNARSLILTLVLLMLAGVSYLLFDSPQVTEDLVPPAPQPVISTKPAIPASTTPASPGLTSEQQALLAKLLERNKNQAKKSQDYKLTDTSSPTWEWKNHKLVPRSLVGSSLELNDSYLIQAPFLHQKITFIDDKTCELAGKKYSYQTDNIQAQKHHFSLYLQELQGEQEKLKFIFVFSDPTAGIMYHTSSSRGEDQYRFILHKS